MAKVVRRENETLEEMLRRWRRKVNDENILGEMKKREAFVSKSVDKRLKKQEAIRKQQKLVRMDKAKEQARAKGKRPFRKTYNPYNQSEQPTDQQ